MVKLSEVQKCKSPLDNFHMVSILDNPQLFCKFTFMDTYLAQEIINMPYLIHCTAEKALIESTRLKL